MAEVFYKLSFIDDSFDYKSIFSSKFLCTNKIIQKGDMCDKDALPTNLHRLPELIIIAENTICISGN